MQAHANLITLPFFAPRSSAARPTLFAHALCPTPLRERAAALFVLLATVAPPAMLGWIILG
jgi:hypothetical protein